MDTESFLVAGGGIAGLAAALALAGAGRSVRVFEQSPAFEEVGAGLQIAPNAVRALQHLGAWDDIAPSCVIPDEIHIRDGLHGRLLQRLRLGKAFEQEFGAPYRVAHRADLLAGLLAAARRRPAIELNTSRRIAAAANEQSGVSIRLAGGGSERGHALIGADGIRSVIRDGLFRDQRPVFRGHVLYRALMPLERLPPSIAADVVTLWLFPRGHVVHYPVSNWRNFNIVAAIEGKWDAPSWSEPGAATELKQVFGAAADPLYELLDAPTRWLKWMAADLDPLPRWADGNIVLVGDAAHATLPYLAQGAAMALEDAATLGRLLAQDPQVARAFAAYAAIRQPRTRRIQEESRRQGRLYHAGGPARAARDTALRLMPASLLLSRLRWIYDWQP